MDVIRNKLQGQASSSLSSWHGTKGSAKWKQPMLVTECDIEARPGYQSMRAHEYLDHDDVLFEKIELLADLITKSKNCLAYTGAGISTSAGIGDYASRNTKDSLVTTVPKFVHPLDARPTLTHRTLVELEKLGRLKYYIQQNHDGLPQKAGFPQHKMNEIHGAWYDVSNPVVPMNGSLRGDLFQDMLDWEEKCDLCLCLGTSLCGMNADRVVTTVSKKSLKSKKYLGSVLISIQQTQYDNLSSLRIFCKLDRAMHLLAKKLNMDMNTIENESKLYRPVCPKDKLVRQDVFRINYSKNTGLLSTTSQPIILDLRTDSKVRLTCGPHKGDVGVVTGKNKEGHYKIRFEHHIKKKGRNILHAPMVRVLGLWFIESLTNGLLAYTPVVNVENL